MATDPKGRRPGGGRGSAPDGRRVMRYPTRFPAELHVRTERLPVTVRDISEAGAMVEGAKLPGAGKHILFVAREIEVEARVIWQQDMIAGIEFLLPVNPLAVVRHNVPDMVRRRHPPRTGV